VLSDASELNLLKHHFILNRESSPSQITSDLLVASMTLKRGSSKLPHSVLHRITQFVSDGEIALNRRIGALLEEPKLSNQTRKLLEKQKRDLGKMLGTLRLVNREFSRLAIEFMNFVSSPLLFRPSFAPTSPLDISDVQSTSL